MLPSRLIRLNPKDFWNLSGILFIGYNFYSFSVNRNYNSIGIEEKINYKKKE